MFPNEEYKFAVVNGDITGDYEVTTEENIYDKLKTIIKEYKEEKKIYDSDILKIVHIIDTDGAFIDDRYIVFHQSDEILYTNSKIRTNHVDKVIKKNTLKKAVVNKLIHTKTIKNIPYEIYFMSCNLDHVLFDEPNQKDYDKKRKALEYADSLFGKEIEFLTLLESNVIKHYNDYFTSWEDIYNGKNSLRRASNFNCYLNQNLKK